MEFKGTPAPWYPTEYSGYWRIMDGYYYEDNDIMDEDKCIHAQKNAQLASCAPELLYALEELMNQYNTKGNLLGYDVNIAREAIIKALTV